MTNVQVTEDAVTVVASTDPVQVKAGGQAAVDAHNQDTAAHPDLASGGGDVVVVKHAADSTVARPSGANVVHWYGTVAPANAAADDLWVDNTNDAPRLLRFDGVAFDEIGNASSPMEIIAETELAAAAASITFSSIPATYRSLMVVGSLRSDLATTVVSAKLRINGDTTAGAYIWQQIYGTGTTVAASDSTSDSAALCLAAPGGTAPAGAFGAVELWLPDYADTAKTKAFRSTGYSRYGSGTQTLRVHGGLWTGTAAVNQLTFFSADGGNLDVGSVLTLYGVNGA